MMAVIPTSGRRKQRGVKNRLKNSVGKPCLKNERNLKKKKKNQLIALVKKKQFVNSSTHL